MVNASSSKGERQCMGKTYSVYCGIDVGKFSHHFAAIAVATGELIFDGKIEQTESKIRATLEHINSHGDTLVVVDQPGSMSALLFAICDDMKIDKGFITPKAMSKAIDMYGGDLKTDAHDALVIAEVSSSLPKLIKPINEKSSLCKQLTTLMSYDRELTEESTRASNRLHDLLLSVCPGLEEYFGGKKIQTCFCLMILSRYGGPAGIKKAGKGNVRRWVKSRKGSGAVALKRLEELLEVIYSQTVIVDGSIHVEELIKLEATYLMNILESRKKVAQSRDELLAQIPEAQLLMTLPGLGAVTCATFLAEVGDISRFSNAAKLASYAGLAPKIRQSGKTVHSVTKPQGGNRRLKRVLVLSASKSIMFSEESRIYYERKKAEGHSYGSCIMALARRRLNVMYAMLRDNKAYQMQNG